MGLTALNAVVDLKQERRYLSMASNETYGPGTYTCGKRLNPVIIPDRFKPTKCRATRRNEARANHELGAWKLPKNRYMLSTTGQHIVSLTPPC